MKTKELRNLDLAELVRKQKDLSGELMNLYFQKHMGQLTNVMRPLQVRRTIAKIKTILREKELINDK